MVAEGADILDIGAESSRPYGDAVAVTLDEEIRRLDPVLPAVAALGVPVSIDTMKAQVAAAAIAAGAACAFMVSIDTGADLSRGLGTNQLPIPQSAAPRLHSRRSRTDVGASLLGRNV